jgi:hypothetical protein
MKYLGGDKDYTLKFNMAWLNFQKTPGAVYILRRWFRKSLILEEYLQNLKKVLQEVS